MTYADFQSWSSTKLAATPDVSVVIPAFNENDRIVPTIGAIAAHLCSRGLSAELIVSDDGSTDGTVGLVRSLGLANVTVLDPGVNRGKGAAVRDGVAAARGDYILFSDADLSTPIEEFDRLLAAVKQGAGVAVASRAASGAEEYGRGRLRSVISSALRGGVRKATGVRVKDTQCGFKLFTRQAAQILFDASRVDGFSFDLEILWLAQRWNIDIEEVPVRWIEAPGSKVSPGRESLRFLRDVAALRYRDLRGHYSAQRSQSSDDVSVRAVISRESQDLPPTGYGETMHPNHLGSDRGGLRIALVTAYPPSQTTLNEYGYHLARHLAAKPEVAELTILHDEVPTPVTDLPEGATAMPAWRYGSVLNPLRIFKAVRASHADVVLVNAHFTSFAAGKVAAALGLMAPALLRAGGTPVVVLLHNLVDTVDLEKAGFSSNPLLTKVLSFLGGLVTRIVLGADKVSVTIPQYVDLLQTKYGARNVYLAPHGSFEEPDPIPRDPEATPTLLAFGKWGTYKSLEVLLDAYAILRAEGIDVEVVVAGTDSHNAVGYLDGVKKTYRDLPGVSFTGYVAEQDVPRVFGSATVAVFPYTSTTGSSGVLHQAGSYGCPVALPDIGDLAEVVRDEGFEAVTFDPGDPSDLARTLRTLLADPAAMASMGRANRAAACGIPLADVADWHLAHLREVRDLNQTRPGLS